MKTKLLFAILFILVITFSFTQCKKEDDPTIPTLTTKLSNVKTTTALVGGEITSSGGANISEQGICYGTTEQPTISNSKVVDNSGLTTFSTELTGLTEGTTYYARAYAINDAGTGYGQSIKIGTFTNKSITMGKNYPNDVYFSLKNGIVASVPRTNWDIAFSVSTRSSSIIINESAGVILKKLPNTWSWDTPVDTTGFNKQWASLHNSNTSWEDGAFNQAPTGGYNYGWGDYNTTSHNIIGVTKYIIKLRDGSYKKIFIELKQSALQLYDFRYANIDGTSPIIITNLSAAGLKSNYIYYNLVDNSVVADREPDATTWDIIFTRWYDISMNYKYATGVLQNIGVKAISLTTDDPNNITYTDTQFSSDINTVGSYWKNFNGSTYTIPTNKVYLIKDNAGKVYQLYFLTFDGSQTGNLSFNIKQL